MRVLVTGGAGFIGSHLADRLVALGHDVLVIDNESTGLRENVPAGAHYVKANVSNREELEPVFARGLDAICHIAGQVSLIRSYFDPTADLRTNVEGTLNVLQLCLKYRIPRLLYAGSMTAYGNTTIVPTAEDAPCEPVSYYGITKYAAEGYVRATARRTDLDFTLNATCFRMYNVYGPRQPVDNPYQGVLGIFLGNVLRGEPITIYGNGNQSRDFVYIEDIVHAWASALENPASFGGLFNLGSGRQLTINDLARLVVEKVSGSQEYPIVHAETRPGELYNVEADISRARRILAWEPQVTFEAGLEKTVAWAAQQTPLSGQPG